MDGQNLQLKWAEFGEGLTLTLFLSREEDDSAWRGLPLLVGLSGSTNRNSVASFMEASASRRRYSSLSITTTPDPLQGFVITMPSCFFN